MRYAPARPARYSLAALHVSLAVLTGFFVSVVLVTGFDAGRVVVEEHFGILRASAYVAWGVGIAAFMWAPVLLVKELGLLPSGLVTMGPRFEVPQVRTALRDAGGRKLVRAFGLGFLANALVLALSPLGLCLGDQTPGTCFAFTSWHRR